ncbi:MAG: HAMP domain-containing histidine kinase [Bacteroidia bacterium]|nr:HAMP domain-containing histidine kinase [Bacteroidia bacterium]
MVRLKNSLYWRISLGLMLLLFSLGTGYLWITSFTAQRFLKEQNQRLYGDIAPHMVQEVKPLVNGNVDTTAIQTIMHSMMIINPSVEVYLLDTTGQIITYVAPYKKVQLSEVSIAPIEAFLADQQQFIEGDDPRHPGKENIFSAAKIEEEGQLMGYIYIILASEAQTEVTSSLFGSYMLGIGAKMFFLTLLGALLIGLLALWLLTRNLRDLVQTVVKFRDGDYQARVPASMPGELNDLGQTFNQMADKIMESFDKIRSIESLRKELIANVSHDLRTPLSITRGYVETLLMKGETISAEQRKQYLETIHQSSERLSRLVSQLFEYSQLEALQIQPNKEPFFIGELVQDVVARYQVLAWDKDITLSSVGEENLPLVHADVALVERVFQNLLDNALKFTPVGGRITLELKAGKELVEICVVDSGKGIPESDKQLIFERYKKAEPQSPLAAAGLGLAIVKKILELHQSAIKVENRPQAGAAFLFHLPVFQAG